jgi:hypothetical protein
MRRLNSPIIFNHDAWGLADVSLDETVPQPQHPGSVDLDPAVIPSFRARAPE